MINVASGASVIISSFEPGANVMLAPTIVRTRGLVHIRPQTFGASLNVGGAFGVGIVSNEAFVAGTASIPRPFDDADWPGWFLWGAYSGTLDFADASGRRQWNLSYPQDSKAMRKVKSNETVVLMAESQTGSVTVVMHLRLLFMMS